MKKYILPILFMSLLYWSCDGSKDENESLIGKWVMTEFKEYQRENCTDLGTDLIAEVREVFGNEEAYFELDFMVDSVLLLKMIADVSCDWMCSRGGYYYGNSMQSDTACNIAGSDIAISCQTLCENDSSDLSGIYLSNGLCRLSEIDTFTYSFTDDSIYFEIPWTYNITDDVLSMSAIKDSTGNGISCISIIANRID